VAQPQYLPQLASFRVLFRFGARMIVLVSFAAFSGAGFVSGLATLMGMAIVFSLVVAIIKRERLFEKALNHWDETVAYATVFSLVGIFAHTVPV
jgi:hypothetical protein